MTNYDKYVAKQMKNEEFRKEYEALKPEFDIMQAMIDARQETGLTQKELSANPSIKTLKRIAMAMGKQLRISFV